MSLRINVSCLIFSDGTKVNLSCGDVVIIVGPNNVGKSASLSDIDQFLRTRQFYHPIFQDIIVDMDGTDDELISYLNSEFRRPSHNNLAEYVLPGSDIYVRDAQHYWHSKEQHGLNNLASAFVDHLSTGARLGNQSAPGIRFSADAPSHPIHRLYKNPHLEDRLSGYFRKAFGQDLIVHRLSGNDVPLYSGLRPAEPSGRAGHQQYYAEVERLTKLERQGDGMKSFVSIALFSFVLPKNVLLIDEPEAFLHPPQANLLARMLVQEKPKDQQLFIATHSADVIRGILDAARSKATEASAPEAARNTSKLEGQTSEAVSEKQSGNIKRKSTSRIKIIRLLVRNGKNIACELRPEHLEKFWSDPLLRYSNIIDGLFHDGVVICEADGDCRFYAAMLDAIRDLTADAHAADLLFTHGGGKARIAAITRALKALDVPVRVIADFDVLSEEQPLRSIIEALGSPWDGNILSDWKLLKYSIDHKKPHLETEDVISAIQRELSKVKEKHFPAEASKRIREILSRTSAWAQTKATGKAFVPSGEPFHCLERLLGKFQTIGLFVVPVGELERWDP